MKQTFVLGLFSILMVSCVSKKQFTELSSKYDDLQNTNTGLIEKNDQLLFNGQSLQANIDQLQKSKSDLANQLKDANVKLNAATVNYDKLKASFDNFTNNSSAVLDAKIKENLALLNTVEEKENKLLEEQANLERLKLALDARSKRIEDLEQLIANKEKAMQNLKDAISNALKGFEGKGLMIENRNGNVYVSMENKLLFASGSWKVGTEGNKAIEELAKVLVLNPSINVLIEGHTDNDPFSGGVIEDNWDLSVKRATAIVRILQTNNVSPKQLTAAGRSEYLPILPNTTAESKSKNRRIEIVLSPNLDEITKLLN